MVPYPEERKQVEKHPIIAAPPSFIKGLTVAKIVRHHHEVSTAGYPDGLKGDEPHFC
jgi:HD-GYP domain-containing protein (c-di-GMP phosphodiesterase class II)